MANTFTDTLTVQLQDINARIAKLTEELKGLEAKRESCEKTIAYLKVTTDQEVLDVLDALADAVAKVGVL